MQLESATHLYKIQQKIRFDFCLVFGTFLVDFWECVGKPGPPKMNVSRVRGANLRKIHHVMSDAVLN